MNRLKRFFGVFIFLLFCIGVAGMAEEITLTTYYPAPYGAYNELSADELSADELRATKLAVGSLVDMPTTDGDLEVSGTIRANTVFNVSGIDGVTGNYMVITNAQRGAGNVVRIKTRTITVKGGIITEISVESVWYDGPHLIL